jgi:predicted Zn finger-like uncharacterized protein
MSLATRCTHCGTIFKVVQDQLKVSEGWVRCGRCHEVFNALPALFDLDTEAPPPRQVPAQAMAQPSPAASAWPNTQPADLSPPMRAAQTPLASTPRSQPAAPNPASARPVAPLTAEDLNLRPPASATDFDLDTSVDLSSPSPAGGKLDLVEDPRPWTDEPPEDLPSTDEADALESRYLLPSRDTRPVRRRERGPEFADARFPSDLDAEDEWARHQESVPAPDTEPPPLPSLTGSAPLPESSAGAATATPSPTAPGLGAVDAEGSTVPSIDAAAAGYVPEQPVQPPSQRRGRSGTRGRDPASQPPEFVRKAQRQAFWRRPAVLAVLGLASLLLSLALALQLTHHFRDVIAAHHPSTKPLLDSWCAQLGCQVRPPLRLDALQVDNATLVRTASEGAERYRLTVAVHNRSDIELAWPHVDLVLTDERGATIARRALAPQDAQVAKGEGLPLLSLPGAAPSGESTLLQWSLRLDGLSPAGYTAELFYP